MILFEAIWDSAFVRQAVWPNSSASRGTDDIVSARRTAGTVFMASVASFGWLNEVRRLRSEGHLVGCSAEELLSVTVEASWRKPCNARCTTETLSNSALLPQ